jgi:hypothetical protein
MHLETAMKKTILTLLTAAMSTGAVAAPESAETFLCSSEQATGFAFDKSSKTWRPVTPDVTHKKYTLALSGAAWEWKDFGEKVGIKCISRPSGFIGCDSVERVVFNKKNLRFMITSPIGYVNAGGISKEGNEAPLIEIGTCSKI